MVVRSSLSEVLIRCLSFVAFLPTLSWAESPKYFKDQYVVELRVSALNGDRHFLSHNLLRHGANLISPLGSGSALVGPAVSGYSLQSLSSAELVSETDEDDFCRNLIDSGVAKSCSPNYLLKISAVPNDSLISRMWSVAELGLQDAWKISTGSSEVVVAVIDTGVDYRHPELAANVWTNPAEIPGNRIDDDNNGYIDDEHGINTISKSGNPFDDNGHGTHVSGTIGAVGNNGSGVAGINWNVRIMGLKFLDATGAGSLAGAIEAINYMVMMKQRGVNIRVVNNSWGGGGFNPVLRNAIMRARDAGIVFVAAAGNETNDNDTNPQYPANYELDNIVSVGAIDEDENLAWFSNYGENTVAITAPGNNIFSTLPGNGYGYLSGTSMAAPHVTGALALLSANEPNLTANELIARMRASGKRLSSLSGLINAGVTLQVGRLMQGITEPLPPAPPAPIFCPYQITGNTSPPPPDYKDGELVLSKVDELVFARIELPFEVPFAGKTVSRINISPNGLIYFGANPLSMDYQNKSEAPPWSWAVLHTDLISSVRVKKDADVVTVYWEGSSYIDPSGAKAKIIAKIHASGLLEQWVYFGSSALQAGLVKASTIGVAGGSDAYTYAVNDPISIHNSLSLRFMPGCSVPTASLPQASVSGVELLGVSKRITAQKSITPGSRFYVDILAAQSGNTEVTLGFNSRFCPLSSSVEIVQEKTRLRGQLPKRLPPQFKLITARAGDRRAQRRFSTKSGDSPLSFRALCRKIQTSLRVVPLS